MKTHSANQPSAGNVQILDLDIKSWIWMSNLGFGHQILDSDVQIQDLDVQILELDVQILELDVRIQDFDIHTRIWMWKSMSGRPNREFRNPNPGSGRPNPDLDVQV